MTIRFHIVCISRLFYDESTQLPHPSSRSPSDINNTSKHPTQHAPTAHTHIFVGSGSLTYHESPHTTLLRSLCLFLCMLKASSLIFDFQKLAVPSGKLFLTYALSAYGCQGGLRVHRRGCHIQVFDTSAEDSYKKILLGRSRPSSLSWFG